MTATPAAEPTCDATIEDGRGRLRQCQLADCHYDPKTSRHYSALEGGGDMVEWMDEAEFATPASSSPPQPTVRVTQYTVNALPEGFPERWRWDLTVQQQRHGHWVIGDGDRLLDVDGKWGHPGAAWDRRFQHTEEQALRLAKQEAPNVMVNGRTPAAVLNHQEQQ